jgi:hypothetical protein
MFNFISGLFFGFIGGFISPYLYNLYKKRNNLSKALMEEAFSICSHHIFNQFYDSTEMNSELVNILPNIIELGKEYNNSFKILFRNGAPSIKIIDKNILQNGNFKLLMEFLKNNDIEIMFSAKPDESDKLE